MLFLGNAAELMVGNGCAMLIALFFFYRQRLFIPCFGGRKIMLFLGNDAQLMVDDGHAILIASFFIYRQRLFAPSFGGRKIPLLLGNDAQLMVGAGRAMRIPLFFFNRQRLFVPCFGGRKIPLLLGNDAQLMVGDGRAMLIALFLFYRQRLFVPCFSGLKIPLFLGNSAQLMVGDGRSFPMIRRFGFSRKCRIQLIRFLKPAHFFRMMCKTLGQSHIIYVHILDFRQLSCIVEVRNVHLVDSLHLIQRFMGQSVRKASHNIHKTSLHRLRGGRLPQQVSPQGRVELVNIQDCMGAETGVFQDTIARIDHI